MSGSQIISRNNGKIFDELLPNPYPFPAQPPSLAQVLTAGDDAGNGNIENLLILQTTNVVQRDAPNPPFLVIGGTITTPGVGGDLRIQGGTLKGSLLVGDGTSTNTIPVGANGTVLKANSAQPLGVEWGVDGTFGITGVSAGANISIDNTNPLVPVISVADPLTSQLNIGSQTIVGATTAITQTTTLDINANSALAGLVELDFNDVAVPKSISAFNNIRISNIEAGAVMKFDTNDTGTGEIKTALKEETIKENEHQISIAIVDTGGITNGEITRTIITSGDETGCEDTITSTDNTNNRVALRKEETDWAFGIVDTSTYTNAFITNTTTSRVEIANNTEVSDTLSFTNGIQTGSYLNKATNSSSRVDVGFTNSSGVGSTTSLLCDITQGQHTISYDGGATLLNTITNTTDTNRSRSEIRNSDGTVNQRNRIDATGLSCSYEQFSQNILGVNKTTSLTTNATTPLTSLTTDAPLAISTSSGDLTLNAPSGNSVLVGDKLEVRSTTVGGIANPLLVLQNTNTTAGSVAIETYKSDAPISTGGDVISSWSSYCNATVSGVPTKVEMTRISSLAQGVGANNNDGTISLACKVNSSLAPQNFLVCNGGLNSGEIVVSKPISSASATNLDIFCGTAGGSINLNSLSNVDITAVGDNLTLTAGTLTLIDTPILELRNIPTTTSSGAHNAQITTTSSGVSTDKFLKLVLQYPPASPIDIWVPYFTTDPSV